MAITAIRGMNDILPTEVGKWQQTEKVARRVFANFGFREIRTPLLEKTELFARSIGETTDIVEKEMYTFADRNNQLLTLRPEATASVVRAFIEHGLHLQPSMQKLYTIGPMFRHERPQKGRYRQFHQINAEVFGAEHPMVDAELIYLSLVLLKDLHIDRVHLHLNSLGCGSCRQPFREALRTYLAERAPVLCADCQRRRVSNPLRVFDCKVPGCRQALESAPGLLDYLCSDCARHFQQVQQLLSGMDVGYALDPHMVRGLDYYTKTAFEIIAEHLGAQNAVGGGGRYDGLMRDLGGPDLPGIGFAIGMERLIMLLDESVSLQSVEPFLFLACLGDDARQRGFQLLQQLRGQGLAAEMDYDSRSLKAQMRKADKLDVSHVLILGEDELARGTAVLRHMRDKTQQEVPLPGLAHRLPGLLAEKGSKAEPSGETEEKPDREA